MPASPEAIERRKARDRAKSKIKRAAEREARLKLQAARPGVRKGSPDYRRQLPPEPERGKSELREILRRAVENTASMGVE